jgi:hypothetical protein
VLVVLALVPELVLLALALVLVLAQLVLQVLGYMHLH